MIIAGAWAVLWQSSARWIEPRWALLGKLGVAVVPCDWH